MKANPGRRAESPGGWILPPAWENKGGRVPSIEEKGEDRKKNAGAQRYGEKLSAEMADEALPEIFVRRRREARTTPFALAERPGEIVVVTS